MVGRRSGGAVGTARGDGSIDGGTSPERERADRERSEHATAASSFFSLCIAFIRRSLPLCAHSLLSAINTSIKTTQTSNRRIERRRRSTWKRESRHVERGTGERDQTHIAIYCFVVGFKKKKREESARQLSGQICQGILLARSGGIPIREAGTGGLI